VRENSAAWKAGFAVGMKIMAVNNREFSPDIWKAAVKATSASFTPITVLIKQAGYYQSLTLNYHGGAKYPHLERIPGTTDMLVQIMTPHATR
jgi:hypothetical protein